MTETDGPFEPEFQDDEPDLRHAVEVASALMLEVHNDLDRDEVNRVDLHDRVGAMVRALQRVEQGLA